MPFTDQQIEKMQSNIRLILDYLEDKNGTRSKAASKVCDEIQILMGSLNEREQESLPPAYRRPLLFDVEDEYLRQFGRGYPSDGKRIYRKFKSEEHNLCVAVYLTHPTTQTKYQLDISVEELGLNEVEHQLPILMARFLNPSQEVGVLGALSFATQYHGETATRQGIKNLTFNITDKIDELVFSAKLHIQKITRERDQNPKIVGDKDQQGANAVTCYEGYLIITNEQNLMFFARNIADDEDAVYLLSLGIDFPEVTSVMSVQEIHSFVFFEHSTPQSIPDFGSGTDAIAHLSDFTQQMLEQEIPYKLLKLNTNHDIA